MAEISEIKRRLVDRVQAVCEHLLPNGRREGREWRAGSVHGEPGHSLGVCLSGDKVGIWADFNGGAGGDLLDLWVQARGIPLADALNEARGWLGIERPVLHRPVKREYARPSRPQCTAPKARVLDYLREERNIPTEIIQAYRVGEDGPNIIFPFLLPDGTLALAKRRRAEAGAKPVPTDKDCEPVMFGWQAVPADVRVIVITEGEIDALSMAAYGHPALSVPFGGGGGAKQQWIESEYERMDRFECIYLALDMDEPGEQAAQEIASRLGRHRCLRVRLPRKDANACLVDGVPKDEIDRAIAEASTYDPEGLRLPSSYADEVVALFYPRPGDRIGYSTPYGKLGGQLLFRPSEITLWSGDSGAGKSQVILDCVCEWVKQGSRICLSSLEMKPQQTFKRMCKQAAGVDRPTEPAIRAALFWLDRGLIAYELVGKAKVDNLLQVFDYARAKYGCDQFVIDSLIRLGIAGDDYNTQEQAIYRLVDWAIANAAHVHLVAHARKGDRDRGAPEIGDVKGAMEIGANAFNIITVWRNRKLEEQIKSAKTEDEREILMEKPAVILNVAKQRNGDFEGKIGLWFDQASYQYRSSHDSKILRRQYLENAAIGEWTRGAA
jgi:twinkle protein